MDVLVKKGDPQAIFNHQILPIKPPAKAKGLGGWAELVKSIVTIEARDLMAQVIGARAIYTIGQRAFGLSVKK
jgi:hypothetical protein